MMKLKLLDLASVSFGVWKRFPNCFCKNGINIDLRADYC
ncbi:hypothetical protein KSS87_001247, partial [Heliosperma pusillum]